MAKKPVNHPAFPVAPYAGDTLQGPVRSNSGMGIRDYFAAAAMSSLILDEIPTKAAQLAYEAADAMMVEREQQK